MERAANGMTTVEKVIALRTIEPFSLCRAEEAMRLASIAEERSFSPDEVIFRADDASDACYCLVEGSISLVDADGVSREVNAPAAVGLVEILSGHRRAATATVTSPGGVRALALEDEDLFDLLSNNIEIVRSLFRALLGNQA